MELTEGMVIATDADDYGMIVAANHKRNNMDHTVRSEGKYHAECEQCGVLEIN